MHRDTRVPLKFGPLIGGPPATQVSVAGILEGWVRAADEGEWGDKGRRGWGGRRGVQDPV